MARATHRTYCRICGGLCGLLVETEADRILRIAPDRDDPLSQGYYCVKGAASKDWHNGDDRLYSSRQRLPDGSFRDIDSEEALDAISERLATIVGRYGKEAVGLYMGTGAATNALAMSALRAWMDLVGSPYLFGAMTVDQSAKWVAACRAGVFATGKFSSLDADLIMLIGTNPAISHNTFGMPNTNPVKGLREARARGMRLYVIDPRATETARVSDLHIPIRPGEDGVLLAGMIRLILANGWHDAAFCGRFVKQVEQLERSVAPFTPDLVAQRTGIAPGLVERLAADFAKAKRRSIFSGTGPNMAAHANVTEHLIEALHAICGAYRRAGDLIHNIAMLNGGIVSQERIFPANRSWESGPRCRTADVGRMFGEFPTPMIPAEIEGKGEDRLRALIVVGGNLLKALGSPRRTKAALEKLDLLVTLSPRTNETADISDYVVATAPMFERWDFTGVIEALMVSSYARVTQPVLPPPPGVLTDLQAFWGLARRMGQPLRLKRPGFGIPYEQAGDSVFAVEPDEAPDERAIVRWMVSQGSTDFDELIAAPQGVLRSEAAIRITAADGDDGARLEACPPDVAAEIARLAADGGDAGYGYRLASRRMHSVMNSAFIQSEKVRRRGRGNPAYLNADDMAQEGLEDGDAIEIESAHGRIVAQARCDPLLRRGVVSIAHAWGPVEPHEGAGDHEEAFTGHLVSLDADAVEPISRMPRQSAIPVTIRPVRTASMTTGPAS